MNILDEDGRRAPLIGVFIADLIPGITDTITGVVGLVLSMGYISLHSRYVGLNSRNGEVFVAVDAGLKYGHTCCAVDGDVASPLRRLTAIVCRVDRPAEAALTIDRENALQTRKKRLALVYRQICLKLLCNYTGLTLLAYMTLLGHKKVLLMLS